MLTILSLFGLAVGTILLPDFKSDADDRSDSDVDAVSDKAVASVASGAAATNSVLSIATDPTPSEGDVSAAEQEERAYDDLIGDDADGVLVGTDADDALFGLQGNDVLYGGAGADVLSGGAGDDIIFSNDDAEGDELIGGDGHDQIFAGQNDHITGGSGDDIINLSTDAAAFVADFNPDDDRIEVVYHKEDPVPELSTQASDDGIHLFADGELVALLGGAKTLDISRVALVAA